MRKAFTLMELVVALAILAVVLSFAGVIFRVSIDSHRLALANAEIMQKLRVLTDQLDADFRSLRKDADIFVVWSAVPKPGYVDPNGVVRGRGTSLLGTQGYERFDRIMFFTTGDFQAYGRPERSNVARICYTMARGPSADPAEPNWAPMQKPCKRMLARTQHLLIPPTPGGGDKPLDVNGFTTEQWLKWNSQEEIDRISLEGWKRMPEIQKIDMLSVIGDITIIKDSGVSGIESRPSREARGVLIDPAQPASIHSLFCQGVGQFMVQGWNDRLNRWIPAVDPDEDGDLADSDFILTSDKKSLDPERNPGLWYPRQGTSLRQPDFPVTHIDQEHFNQIPGLGRALKFTFTLYDSRNLIKNGRTFTHVVYLDN
ncbi:MAG TPA: prepilin-type N-terminal cleavage/methylation domain-containing protein [Sedimentisphaerales bacterium]|nr:prepilin-type N-terminal cleavage/methylation domain-containing protein [Sedimentisphaerales bacterium]HQG48171.1 prepilin-type N-terminal cleavage/methylation domain-containing protein [Sedimentisphaerales bacterium]